LSLEANGPLSGRHIVVTAGATREAIDPIRIMTNRSTGKMGYSIAQAALRAGARVTLISAPTALAPIYGANMVDVESAISMRDAVQQHAVGSDVLIMAAAVADYRPLAVAQDKIKKTDDEMSLQLVRNPDILATVATPGTLRIGFAAETRDHQRNAVDKLHRKNLDMIVMNDARVAMGSDQNAITIYYRDGRHEVHDLESKTDTGEALISCIAELFQQRDS
jgi:phosphopantothenoylcysteine decarboxylase/phosphopantothenate--cysteine ligase